MKPILPGGRGPAVEDIQRRLLRLGYELGPTGVDGVFLGMTTEAVRSFQAAHGLSEDGIVGEETWASLVDATFTLGDRMLYLRSPYFHGSDVLTLQQALNTLGFWCGDPDGILGPFTERGVREFQRSCGQGDDGIAGLETIRALMSLRHVWEGKDVRTPVTARASVSRAADVLSRASIYLVPMDGASREIAERVANLALAANDEALVEVAEPSRDFPAGCVVLSLAVSSTESSAPKVVIDEDPAASSARLMTALVLARSGSDHPLVDLSGIPVSGEAESQRVAVRLLDAMCAALG